MPRAVLERVAAFLAELGLPTRPGYFAQSVRAVVKGLVGDLLNVDLFK